MARAERAGSRVHRHHPRRARVHPDLTSRRHPRGERHVARGDDRRRDAPRRARGLPQGRLRGNEGCEAVDRGSGEGEGAERLFPRGRRHHRRRVRQGPRPHPRPERRSARAPATTRGAARGRPGDTGARDPKMRDDSRRQRPRRRLRYARRDTRGAQGDGARAEGAFAAKGAAHAEEELRRARADRHQARTRVHTHQGGCPVRDGRSRSGLVIDGPDGVQGAGGGCAAEQPHPGARHRGGRRGGEGALRADRDGRGGRRGRFHPERDGGDGGARPRVGQGVARDVVGRASRRARRREFRVGSLFGVGGSLAGDAAPAAAGASPAQAAAGG